MDSLFFSEEPIVTFGPDVCSFSSLLEYGLQGMGEGHCAEKIAPFALAHDQLVASQAPLMAIIGAFTQSYAKYQSALQMLQETSKRFAEANTELQANVGLLEKLLPNLVEATDLNSLTVPQCLRSLLVQQEPSPSLSSLKNSPTCETVPQLQPLSEGHNTLPTLYFTCFGHFEVRRLGQPLALCQSRRGQAILRYLVTQPAYRAVADSLIEALWPHDELDVARRKLQIAVSALRRSLNSGYACDSGGGYILFKDQVYLFNPAASFRSDVDEFLELYQAAQQARGSEAIAQYERGCRLYTGPFLAEDIYADWSFTRREQLSQIFQKMCSTLAEYYLEAKSYEDAENWVSAILKENSCDEAAHRQLIRAYAAQGRRCEALRQYHRCEHILREELGVSPMPETVHLWQVVLTCENGFDVNNENRENLERK